MSNSTILNFTQYQKVKTDTHAVNIANNQTLGFKSQGVDSIYNNINEFASFLENKKTSSNDTEGNVLHTKRSLNISIRGNEGNGFFLVQNPEGKLLYTRRGDFEKNHEGFLVNGSGNFALGIGVDKTTAKVDINSFTRINLNEMVTHSTEASNKIALDLKLNSEALINSDANSPEGSFFSKDTNVYDSLGNIMKLQLQGRKIEQDKWKLEFFLEDANGGMIAVENSSKEITFDQLESSLATLPEDWSVNISTVRGETITLAIDPKSKIEQFAIHDNNHQVNLTTNGSGYSKVNNFEFNDQAILQAKFDNGSRKDLIKLGICSFPSPNHLTREGRDAFVSSQESGQHEIHFSLEDSVLTFSPQSVEQSNVDSTDEMLGMKESAYQQRLGYRVLSIEDKVKEDEIQLIK